MSSNLQDNARRAELALKAYATERLNEEFPESVTVTGARVFPESGYRWLTANIGNQLAFGKGDSDVKAVANLIANHRPYTPEERAEQQRTHMYNLVNHP